MSDSQPLDDAKELLKKSVIKIKNTDQMFTYILKVFKTSELKVELGYFTLKEKALSFHDGALSVNNETVKQMVESLAYKEKRMGEIIPFESDRYIVVPIFESSNESEILVVESNDDIKNFIEEEFSTVLQNIHIYRQLKLKCENLVVLSNIDEVTGLFNQRKLIADLDQAIISHDKMGESFSLMFVDIDFFKQVNDTYGHLIGSEILQDLGALLSDLVRSTDDVYRFGGDEFIIILREVDIKTVHMISLRILKSIQNHDFNLSTGEVYKMSISIGIAEYPTDAKSSKEIIQLADNMMYESKKTGRGKVIHLGAEVTDVNARSK